MKNPEKITGKCSYCKEKAVAIIRTKLLCPAHYKAWKKGGLFIPAQ